MANEQNLRPGEYKLTLEEQKKGAIASVEARRRKKTMREQLEMVLKLQLKNDKLKEQIHKLGIDNEEINNQMALTISMFQKALKGDTKAYEIIRDTIGEKPIEQIQQLETPKIVDDIK